MRVQFWSSVEYGGFLKGLIRELNRRGVHAEQCFAISEDRYRGAYGSVSRMFLRIQQYFYYPLLLVYHLLFKSKADFVVVSTNTFYAPLMASFLHGKMVHLVYDLFPEAIIKSGKLDSAKLPAKFMAWITQTTIHRATANIYLGKRLLEYSSSSYPSDSLNLVIPVGADAELFQNRNFQKREWLEILYCGNFGSMHEAETLFCAWDRIANSHNRSFRCFLWKFFSSGPRFNDLVNASNKFAEAKYPLIEVRPGLKQFHWVNAMQEADIALITMIPGSEKVVMPSKTYSAMCAGQAILAIAPESSDLVDLIKENECGWWVEPGKVDAFLNALEEIVLNRDVLSKKKKNARAAGVRKYSQHALSENWIRLFQNLG